MGRRFNSEGPSCHETPTNRLLFNPLTLLWYVRTIYHKAGRMVHFDTSRPMDEEATLAAGMAIVVEGNEIQSIQPSQDIIDEFGLGVQGTSASIEGIHIHDLRGRPWCPVLLMDTRTSCGRATALKRWLGGKKARRTQKSPRWEGVFAQRSNAPVRHREAICRAGYARLRSVVYGHHAHGSKKRLRIIN